MKLNVKAALEDGTVTSREIDIKNPKATVANMRAAISIIMKLGDVSTFRFTSPDADLSAKNDNVKLTDTALKEGSFVQVTHMRRGRDDCDNEKSESEKSTVKTAAAQNEHGGDKPATTDAVAAVDYATAEKMKSLTDMGFTDPQARTALIRTSGNEQRAIEMVLAGHVSETGALQGVAAASASASASASAAPGTGTGTGTTASRRAQLLSRLMQEGGLEMGGEDDGDEEDDEFDDDDFDDEEEDDFGDFDDEEEDFEEEEESEEDRERSQLAMGLMALGNPNDLAQQFLANPQEMLARIQREQPELFALIGRHNQFFIDLVNTGAELAGQDLREDGEDEEDGSGDDAEEGLDVQALAAAAAQALGRRRRGPRSGNPAAVETPPVLTEKDNENIAGLTQLGFTTEQCTAAYLKCGRNPERAGNYLFENPGQ